MAAETIEFLIHPDGSVEERTVGLKGAACEQVTAALEAALGDVTDREPTAERYESAQTNDGLRVRHQGESA